MQETTRLARLVFGGEQTIRNCAEARDRLLAAIAENDTVVIDCRSLTEADLTLVQTLVAARRSADASGRRLRLSAPVAGPLQDVLRRGGFTGGAADACSADDTFWTTVEDQA